jgi:hypothetical protein
MSRMTIERLRKRDMKRNIGKELLQAAREMKAGKAVRLHRFDAQDATILSEQGKSRLSILVENPTLEYFMAESTRTGKEYQTLINEALSQQAFVNRLPLTAPEVRKIIREELARSTKGQTVHRRHGTKTTRVRSK